MEIKNKGKWQEQQLEVHKIAGEFQLSPAPLVKKAINDFQPERVLDLGCGGGRYTFYLAEMGCEVVAADISEEAIDKLESKAQQKNMMDLQTVKCDFAELPLDSNSFEAVVSRSTLHHAELAKIKAGIEEVYRVLKPGGCFIGDLLATEDPSYGQGEKIAPNTFVGSRSGEPGVIHYYTSQAELERLLSLFTEVDVRQTKYWFQTPGGVRQESYLFNIIAYK